MAENAYCLAILFLFANYPMAKDGNLRGSCGAFAPMGTLFSSGPLHFALVI